MGKLYFRWCAAVDGLHSDEGAGVVEIALIIIVIIALVVIFRDEMSKLVNNIFRKIGKEWKTV